MREYKIYYSGNGANSQSFEDFAKGIAEEINSNKEIMERARTCNADFAAKVAGVLSDPENSIYSGAMIAKIMASTPRYMYLKSREYNGKRFDVEIDLLVRKFSIGEQ